MRVAKKHDIPIILHSRKAERRVFEMLQEEEVDRLRQKHRNMNFSKLQ